MQMTVRVGSGLSRHPDPRRGASEAAATARRRLGTDRQALLAEPDALRRLAAERALLSRETAMLRTLTSTPAPDLRNTPYSPN